jgi:hypothetical protein
MQEELQLNVRSIGAVVRRVVPGVVYVELTPDKTIAFKLDSMMIREGDGSIRPYRGEPLSSLGVTPGRKVTITDVSELKAEPKMIVDSLGSRIGSTVSNTVTIATNIFDYLF